MPVLALESSWEPAALSANRSSGNVSLRNFTFT
jgi:hypothetical protein